MTQFSIILKIEGGGEVEIHCRDAEDYKKKSEICERILPDKDWKEKGITKDGKLMTTNQLWRKKNPNYEKNNTKRRAIKKDIQRTIDFLKTLNDTPSKEESKHE